MTAHTPTDWQTDKTLSNFKPNPLGKRPVSKRNAFAILDLGSHKIACVIITARTGTPGSRPDEVQVLGHSIVRAAGIAGGRVSNMAAAEGSLRNAIERAEAQAGISISTAIVTGSFQDLRCEAFNARLGETNTRLADADQDAIFEAAHRDATANQRHLTHVFARPPRGLASGPDRGYEPTDVISVTFPLNVARQIALCCAQAHVQVTEFIAAPIASGLIAALAEERLRGAVLIDMGASTTGVAVFSEGVPVCAASLPFGGREITRSIAEAFRLRPVSAEQLKLRHATAFGGLTADRDLPFKNEETGEAVSKAALNRLVRKEAATQLLAVNEWLKGKGYSPKDCAVILTGGASQLPGLFELGSENFGARVRPGSFPAPGGLKADPSMAALFGACSFVSRHHCRAEIELPARSMSRGSGYAARIGGWLRASF